MIAYELLRAFKLRVQLLEFFEPEQAELWLVTPQALLDGKEPCKLLATAGGHARVQALIQQLRDGTFQ